jgi:hypothetical protein
MAGDNREKLLQTIKIKGPVIPAQIKDVINKDILVASAMLSELASNSLLKVSSLKIGGSPLYYVPGQENRLQSFASKLNEKDKRTYDLLKEKRVLRDKGLDPLTRVSLRQIKDFAKPLEVSSGEEKEIFWKWYLAPDEEVNTLIKKIVGIKEEVPKPEIKKQGIEPIKPELVEKPKQEIIERKEELIKKAPKAPKPLKPKRFVEVAKADFSRKVHNYFKRKNIEVLEQEVVRKNTDIDFIILLPTAVGSVKYYCKAKSKKRPSDADLASAFVQGQQKKLPVLFLTLGDLTKRAKEMLNKEFKSITIKKI